MACASVRSLRRDASGAAILEFTIVAGVMVTVLFGIVEFTHVFYQWNAATKAVQVGTRLAAVSAPVWQEASTLTGMENGATPGQTLATGYAYSVTCSGHDNVNPGTCSMTSGSVASATYNPIAMNTLVFGRGSAACKDPPGTYFGMCDIFDRIAPENVQVTYDNTLAGYAGRPGGIVPTIALQITGLNFQFVFLDDLLDFGAVPIPGLRTTMIAEDMRTSAPTFGGTSGGGTTTGGNGNGNGNGGNSGGNGNGNGNGN